MRKIRTIRLIVALGLGLLVGLPQTSIAQESSEFTKLRLEVRTEAINRMVDAIASRLERIDPAKAERVRTTRPSESFVKGHLDAGVDATLDALFKGDLSSGRLTKTDLKFDMELFRSVDRAYTVKPFKASDMPPLSGFEPPRATGYPAEVAAIDNAAPHSMHDMPDYLADRFTRAALDRAVRNGYTVEIHVGGETDALSDLRNRGYTVTGEVKSGNGNYERLLVAEKAGEVRYVVSGTVDGMDRVRHLAALLRFAGPEGKGIAPDKLVVVGDADALREANTRTMAEGLSRMGLPSETAIIGFRGTLQDKLLERALARRGAEHVSDLLGSDPATALEDQVRAERDAASGERRAKLDALLGEVTGNKKLAGLKAANNPERVFSNIGDLKDLVGAERELARLAKKHSSAVLDGLVADGKLRLPGGASAKDFTISRPLEFGALRAEEIRVRRANGTVEGVRLINNYYGDAMSSVVRALLETGHTKLAYFGTAGGVAPGVKVGDIHIPDKVYDFRGELASEGVRNAFLDKLDPNTSSLGKRLHLNTELGNVFSPPKRR